ncbi:hypothetical protein A3K34_01570 [candidate division WWE3 bacterium RIFOXYC1_FULL_40_10]|uniref:Uncharacterized protein n=1 Tax=candidate division WWE3 bacterium RIFOXYA2_FULL_46_9 TaxID=1802636 RepID=A0A1F4W2J9_UNCKA|nr:MAG: hypothetical protein A3K58_01570 [candidate division WWE3 bacterium RIFOXYB1_FULL_40_22]OGC61554.1 MAG: hypothetical protein A3K37_01570 [candidate division WWE3 bacterium RIFOXYA1_FULL_40_11]OGC63600.1 MAG: hypothetical protein A2264_04510 [candidate division WWE3 bacterium RIFOXYA2_FULL_46_9]OGC65937.1 MAG: hypothetical protein A3K34_01570 [candidate division WWE3 bacterium RIFOXYC1_FULL_40_10]OGC67085.1 MAG: hypothetical protein A2450_04375 [candidate division WWE3 bacterium RIFOXYC2
MKTKIWNVLCVLLVLVLAVSSCAPKPPSPLDTFSEDFRASYVVASKVYSSYVDKEVQRTQVFGQMTVGFDAMLANVKDEVEFIKLCFSNYESFFTGVAFATFGENGLSLTAEQESEAWINALVLNQTHPDLPKCQENITSAVIKMRADRATVVNLKGELLRINAAISDTERGELGTALVIEFYKKYSGDLRNLVQAGDSRLAELIHSQNLQELPLGFVGFPTDASQATTRNLNICNTYRAVFAGEVPPPYGFYKDQFRVGIDPATSVCTLYAAAADGYIRMVLTPSTSVGGQLEEGCTSAFGCEDENK